jgi:hypothetical protein
MAAYEIVKKIGTLKIACPSSAGFACGKEASPAGRQNTTEGITESRGQELCYAQTAAHARQAVGRVGTAFSDY